MDPPADRTGPEQSGIAFWLVVFDAAYLLTSKAQDPSFNGSSDKISQITASASNC